jgi:hypothetical protein
MDVPGYSGRRLSDMTQREILRNEKIAPRCRRGAVLVHVLDAGRRSATELAERLSAMCICH